MTDAEWIGFKYRAVNKLWHVRAVVDGDYIVVRRWNKRRQSWVYQVEDKAVIEALLNSGAYERVK